MGEGAIIVIALRVVLPLVIFRYNFWGGVFAMLLDGADVILIDIISWGGFGSHYHATDKILDMYYMGIEAIVAFRWVNPWAKWTALALFGLRTIGFFAFEVTGARIVLFVFPNLFENWWLYCAAVFLYWPRLAPSSWRTTLIPLGILLIPKMAQEYVLHFSEAQPWNWTKDNVLGWNR